MNSSELTELDYLQDKTLRKAYCERSLAMFAKVYLGHYLTYFFDEFHLDLFEALEDDNILRTSIVGFRESAKSAIVNTVYSLWCVVYKKRHFILTGSEEIGLATVQTTSVAYELLFNKAIIKDFGRLFFDEDEGSVRARKRTIADFVCKNGVRLKAVSAGTKVRGLRHNEYRPDLVLLDDMDSLRTVPNEKVRDAKYDWFKSEILPGMNQAYGKVVVLGNMIHYDCFMARIQKESEGWKHLNIPIYEGEFGEGRILWRDKYVWTEEEAREVNKTREKDCRVVAIETIKKDKGSRTFGQEYMLVPSTDEDRIFKRRFIEQCFDFERNFESYRETATWSIVSQGNDLAISERESADYFVISTLGEDKATGKTVLMNIYRDKNLTPEQQRQAVKSQCVKYNSDIIFVEDNAYQAFFVKDLQESTSLPVKGFRTGTNKRDEIIGLNGLALALENNNIIIPYGEDDTRRLVDVLVEEMLQYPDGHTGDVLMSFWFSWLAMKDFLDAPMIDMSIDKGGFYKR